MSFADNLIELRKYHDLSQEELAEKIGVSRQTLSKYETGESLPDIEKSKILADAFGSAAWLETMVALEKCGLKDRSVVYTGANLPMLLQLYDEDEWVKRNTKDILMNVNHQAA